jgi:hypothetical protein
MVAGAAFIVRVGRDNEEGVLSFDQLRGRDSSVHREHEVELFAIFDTHKVRDMKGHHLRTASSVLMCRDGKITDEEGRGHAGCQ